MSRFKDSLEDRLKAAQAAKQAMRDRFSARPREDDPALVQKRAERQAILEARAVRQVELDRKKEAARAEKLRQAEADLLAQAEERKQAERDAIVALENAEALKIQQKNARDARYAARKARK